MLPPDHWSAAWPASFTETHGGIEADLPTLRAIDLAGSCAFRFFGSSFFLARGFPVFPLAAESRGARNRVHSLWKGRRLVALADLFVSPRPCRLCIL